MENIRYTKIESKSVKDLNNLFLLVNDNGVQKYVEIKNLAILDGKSMIEIKTVDELKKAIKENRIYTKKANGAKDKQVAVSGLDFYQPDKKTAESKIGSSYFISTTIQGDYSVPVGFERVVRIKKDKEKEVVRTKVLTQSLEKGEYLLVTLENGTKKYLSRDEIISSKGNTLGSSKLSLLKKRLEEKEVEDLNKNKIVEIDLTKAYIFENFTYKDPQTKEEKPYREEVVGLEHRTLSINDGENPKYNVETVDALYTHQRYLKDDDKPIIRVTNYETSNNESGEYVKVAFAGDSTETMLSKQELFLDSALTKPVRNFNDKLVGKVLYAKSDDENTNFKVTQPLSVVQASYTYSKKKYLQETEKSEDVCAPGTYLKLETGKYVKEAESVRPICYDYAKYGETPEAYLAKVVDSDKGHISIIIPVDAFKKNSKSEKFKYAGYTISNKDIFGLKKSSKRMVDCDVIQTSTEQDDYQNCKVLRIAGMFDGTTHERETIDVENIEEIVGITKEEFLRDYKDGKYIINQVLNEKGQYETFIRGKRYVFKDHMDLPDYSNGYGEYAYVKANGKYDTKKGIKAAFKTWGKKAGPAALFAYGIGWPFFAVSPALACIVAGAFAVSALMVPISQFIKAHKENKKNRVAKDKTKCASKINKLDILKELQSEYNKAVKKGKKFTQEDELRFIERMENLEKQSMQLAGGMTIADFKIKNGKMSTVDSSNVGEFKKYQAEMYKEEQELSKLLDDMKKGKITRETYNGKYNEHQEHLYNYVSKGIFVPKDEKYQAILDAIRTTKGFVVAKFGNHDSTSDKDKNIKSKLQKKELRIGKDFSCSITKTKKEEASILIDNLRTIADGKPVDYDRVIIRSVHEGLKDSKLEYHEPEVKVTIEEVKEDEKDKEDEIVEEVVEEEKTVKKDRKKDSKKEEKPKKSKEEKEPKKPTKSKEEKKDKSKTTASSDDDLTIPGLGFEIIVYKESKKQTESKEHMGALEARMEAFVKSEKLTKASLDRIEKAIEYLDSEANMTKKQKAALTQYIENNLKVFKKSQVKEKYPQHVQRINSLNKQYTQTVSQEKDAGKTT